MRVKENECKKKRIITLRTKSQEFLGEREHENYKENMQIF